MSGQEHMRAMTVRGYAMWTAAGHDGPSSVAAMRAGVSGAAQSTLWDPSVSAYLSAFRVNAHQWWEGESFLPQLIAPVILECWEQIAALGVADPEDVPILINVAPPDRPGRSAGLERMLTEQLPALIGRPLPRNSSVFSGGRVGLPYALSRSRALNAPLVMAIGAESFLRQRIVAHYLDNSRILSGATTSGFLPGEAAAAALVSPGRHRGLVLTGFGRGQEASGDGGSRAHPVTGNGLAEAMRGALRGAERDFYDITVSMGDLNGEHFKFKEHAFAVMRLDRLPPENRSRRPREHLEHWNVVETIGECGAAILPAALGWAFEAGRTETLPGRVMFSAGEDNGDRVAMVGEWNDG